MKIFFDNSKAEKTILKELDNLVEYLDDYKRIAKIAYDKSQPKELRNYAFFNMKTISLSVSHVKYEVSRVLK